MSISRSDETRAAAILSVISMTYHSAGYFCISLFSRAAKEFSREKCRRTPVSLGFHFSKQTVFTFLLDVGNTSDVTRQMAKVNSSSSIFFYNLFSRFVLRSASSRLSFSSV